MACGSIASSLDWVGAGEVWATRSFRMRKVGMSSLYRHEVRHSAIEALEVSPGRVKVPFFGKLCRTRWFYEGGLADDYQA